MTDSAHVNSVLFLELGPEDSGKPIEIVYDVERLEKGAYPGGLAEAEKYLQPEQKVPADEKIKAIAEQAVEGREDDLMRARALYDIVIDRTGCDAKTG